MGGVYSETITTTKKSYLSVHPIDQQISENLTMEIHYKGTQKSVGTCMHVKILPIIISFKLHS